MDKLGITTEQLQLIKTFFPSNYNVVLYGSRIKGGWSQYSDLDICINNQAPADLSEISYIREKFENSNLPFTVDIVDYNRCDEHFRTVIDETGMQIT